DPERARRHLVGDDRAGPDPGVVADRHGRDERGVDAAVDPFADRRAVLAAAVVVGGDRARAEVRAGADLGVADVGEVRHLRALADLRVLDLDERAGLGTLVQQRTGTQIGERADARAGTHLGAARIGVGDLDVVAERDVDQRRKRTDVATGADP